MTMARTLFLAAFAAFAALLVASPASAQADKARQMRADRATAQHLAARMPEAIADWKATRPKVSWRDDGAEARAKYWARQGRENFTLVLETRSRGLMYKSDLLDDPKRAERYGYEVKTIGGHPALVRSGSGKTEVRMWVDKRILVLAVGQAKLETIEAQLQALDFEKLRAVK